MKALNSFSRLNLGDEVLVYAGPCYGRRHRVVRDDGQTARVKSDNGQEFSALKIDMELVEDQKRSLFLVSGWCRLLGRCRDMVWAVDPEDAARRFFKKHHLEAQEVRYEHA